MSFEHCLKALAVSPNDFSCVKKENKEEIDEVLCYGNLKGLLFIETRKKP